MFILKITLILIGSYFIFYSTFSLALILISVFSKKGSPPNTSESNPQILIILPAYKPGPIFYEVLDSTEYATSGRDIRVYVLLQEAETGYAEYARKKGFYVEEEKFSHLPGNSYQHALRHIRRVIIQEQEKGRWHPKFIIPVDKDNILSKDFFNNIPEELYKNYHVIQGKRAPLNTDTAIAFFDSMTEALNDCMFRSAKARIGSMVEISGSGVLIATDLFLQAIDKLDPNAPGFDKNFMVQLISSHKKVRTIFWPASELKEEKTAELMSFNRQRLRWFGEQYYNALFHGKTLIKTFHSHRRFAALDYLITLWRPPRSVQFALTPLLALVEIALLFFDYWPLQYPLFSVACVILITAITLFLLREGAFTQAMKHSTKLPVLAYNNFFTAARSIKKENRGSFVHTTHKL
jgi:hypothetical protein